MKLTIVIPALNEENAVAQVIERCLEARAELLAETAVTAVDVVLVSDGSTDKTAAIASGYAEITLIDWKVNRGYGAAIQAGWEKSGGELLAFLDCDGTCDARLFVPMCQKLVAEDADIALGNRMGPESRMPGPRRLGNRAFARLLGYLSETVISDCTSGMRVVRRRALPYLLPLPNNLTFTPAMSSRAFIEGRLKVVDVPIPYAERIGVSKLSIASDGLPFLWVIMEAALAGRPWRLLGPPMVGLLALGALAALTPLVGGLGDGIAFLCALVAGVLVTVAVTLGLGAALAQRLIAIGRPTAGDDPPRPWPVTRDRRVQVATLPVVLLALGALVSPVFSAGGSASWMLSLVAGFVLVNLAQVASAAGLVAVAWSLGRRRRYLPSDGSADC